MTEHDKLMSAVLSRHVRDAINAALEELVASTLLAIRQDPRSHGFVTLKDHDARASELLAANNVLLERARAAEAELDAAMSLLTDIAAGKQSLAGWKTCGEAAITGLLGLAGAGAPPAAAANAGIGVYVGHRATYAGTGRLEGIAELKGWPKPICIGTCLNITPFQPDPADLVYQVHDGAVEAVSAVYDQGHALQYAGDFRDITMAGCVPGYYITQKSGGYIRLGAKPAGLVTADVTAAIEIPACRTHTEPIVTDLHCGLCHHACANILSCISKDCPVMAAKRKAAQ